MTPEEEEELIQKVAMLITKRGWEGPAIILLEMIKPVSFISGELGRLFLAPLLVLIWPEGFSYLNTFEERKNIERVIKKIEETVEEQKKKEKKKETRKGWRRLLPF